MSEAIQQRRYLVFGSILLLIFSFAAALTITTLGASDQLAIISVIIFSITLIILLFNTTLLCGTNGGAKVLATARTLLWFSFFLIAVAISLCIALMVRSL